MLIFLVYRKKPFSLFLPTSDAHIVDIICNSNTPYFNNSLLSSSVSISMIFSFSLFFVFFFISCFLLSCLVFSYSCTRLITGIQFDYDEP